MSTANCFDSEALAIASLIAGRLRELGLRPADLVRQASYKNIAKGLRRLDELLAGELDKTTDLICALPAALDLAPETIDRAIEQTRSQIAQAEQTARLAREAAWRAAFRPHAIILTEWAVPQPMFIAAFLGVERLLRIDFDLTQSPVSYVSQALAGIRWKTAEFRTDAGRMPETLPAFGRPVGVVVNYTPDRAVRFDLAGNALDILPRAHRPADVSVTIRGRLIPPETLHAIMRSGAARDKAKSGLPYLV